MRLRRGTHLGAVSLSGLLEHFTVCETKSFIYMCLVKECDILYVDVVICGAETQSEWILIRSLENGCQKSHYF